LEQLEGIDEQDRPVASVEAAPERVEDAGPGRRDEPGVDSDHARALGLRDVGQHIDQRRLADPAGAVQEQHPEREGLGGIAIRGEAVEGATQQLDLA
jgi:hypothetical protein